MRRSDRGFTLVELMVVVAIIMVLVSILYSVYTRTRARGTDAACMTNLGQLSKAMLMYRNDNDGFMPYMVLEARDPASGRRYYHRWVHALMPYVNNDALFACPGNKVSMEQADRPTTEAPGPETSYFYCSFYMQDTPEADVLDVSGTIVLMDGWFFPGQGGPGGWNYPMFSAPLADAHQMAGWINRQVVGGYVNPDILARMHRHSGGQVGVAAYDGHAKLTKSARPQDFTPARD